MNLNRVKELLQLIDLVEASRTKEDTLDRIGSLGGYCLVGAGLGCDFAQVLGVTELRSCQDL